jgi:hypothetical protein
VKKRVTKSKGATKSAKGKEKTSSEDEDDNQAGDDDIKMLLEAKISKALSCENIAHFGMIRDMLDELKSKTNTKEGFMALLQDLPKMTLAAAYTDIGKKSGYRRHQVARSLLIPEFVGMIRDVKGLLGAAEFIMECPKPLLFV